MNEQYNYRKKQELSSSWNGRPWPHNGPKSGGAVPLSRGELDLRLTQCCCAPFRGELGPQYNVAWAKVYFHTKWRLHPSSHLATIDMGRKLGSRAPFCWGVAATPSNRASPSRGLPPYQVASWSTRQFGHNIHKPKLGGIVHYFLREGSWLPVEHKLAWAEAYLNTKRHLNPSGCLAATDVGHNLGAVPL